MCGLRSPTAKISTLTNSRQKPKHARGLTTNQPLGSKSTGEADTSEAPRRIYRRSQYRRLEFQARLSSRAKKTDGSFLVPGVSFPPQNAR